MRRDKRNNMILASTKTKNRNRDRDAEIAEDVTYYGEFVPSFDVWITPEKQKEMAEYLENLGENRHGD